MVLARVIAHEIAQRDFAGELALYTVTEEAFVTDVVALVPTRDEL